MATQDACREQPAGASAASGTAGSPAAQPHATHPTPAQRRAVSLALLAALTMALSFVEVPAWVPWLKFDPSGVVSLFAGLAFGPLPAMAITLAGWLPHLFFDPFGTLIAIATMACAVATSSLVARRVPTAAGRAAGLLAGGVAFVAMALALNVLITPLYNAMPVADVLALAVPVLLPFNVVKFLACAAGAFALAQMRARRDTSRQQ